MHLATEAPSVTFDGDRIVASFPSGRETIEISLTINQATHLSLTAERARCQAFLAIQESNGRGAQIVPFRKPKRSRA